MALWKKIYIIFFICFIISFNLAGIVIIERIHNQTIQREVDNALSEHKNNLLEMIYKLNRSEVEYSNNIKAFIESYAHMFGKEEEYIEVLDLDNNTVFSNIEFTPPKERKELESLVLYERKFIIRKVDGKMYLFMSGLIELNKEYKLSYIKDLSYSYQERKDQYKYFFLFEGYICLIFGVLIFVLSKYLTRPVDGLIKTTEKIAGGDYHQRVEVTSRDELGTLSNNFNKMAQVIEEKINELEGSNVEKQRFIENLTHELKTPLTSIIGYANLLRTTKVDEKTQLDAVDFIYKEGKRLEQLSFRMMDLIILKVDDFRLKPERIMEVFQDVKKGLIPKLKEKNMELNIHGRNNEIFMEKDLIRILLTNLIDNSIKASERNKEIDLRFYEKDNKKIIEVEDKGMGISPENIKRIQEPFYVVDKSRTRLNNGAGLGLAICKRIVEIHNAEFQIDSELNIGTSIKIIFQ